MRAERSTWVASTTTSAAPELASMPRCIKCQSLAQPSSAEYWHIGETTMRLASSRPANEISLAGLELANRIVVSPMCQYSADDGCANDWHLMHRGMLANSGASLVVVEATHVERSARITHGCMGL